jgi:hypothetical protein
MPFAANIRSVENRMGANEANQTRSEDEADVRQSKQTDAPAAHIERPIGPVQESISRFHPFPLDFFPSNQNFRKIDFDLPGGWIMLVGRHPTNSGA